MPVHSNAYPENFTSPEKTTVIVISNDNEDHAGVDQFLPAGRWTVEHFADLRAGLKAMQQLRHCIVVTERRLPDGNWRDVLTLAGENARVVVTCKYADEQLWAEVLNNGGYDLLGKPFNRSEMSRIVQAAAGMSNNPEFRRGLTLGPGFTG